MSANRWDETWHRLLDWTNGQGPSERLAAQILLSQGFEDLDPSHPLGGKDGGKDAVCKKAGKRWVMGVYFPRGQQEFREIERKFTDDLEAARANQADGFAFVTNQELRLAERGALNQQWPDCVELFHLERVTTILDTPKMADVRKQFLAVDYDNPGKGGKGGDAKATNGGTALGGTGGDAGTHGDGGPGGTADATGKTSLAIGGRGGRGGLGPGMPGGNTTGSIGDIIIAGDGGDAPRPDGRGGRGGRNRASELLGRTKSFRALPDGRSPGEGGRGANTPEYDGKVKTVKSLLREYYNETPSPASFQDRHLAIPLDWLNARLSMTGIGWRVQLDEDEFTFVDSTNWPSEDFVKRVAKNLTQKSLEKPDSGPKGIALINCIRVEWKKIANNTGCSYNFFSTFDGFTGPCAVNARCYAVELRNASRMKESSQ